MKIATIKTGLASLAMLPGLVMAAPAVADKADNAFMMICTALVLFMTIPGIALFYGGLIRGKNVLSMLTQVTVTFECLTCARRLAEPVARMSSKVIEVGLTSNWQGEVIQTLPPVEKRPYRVDFWVFNRRRT